MSCYGEGMLWFVIVACFVVFSVKNALDQLTLTKRNILEAKLEKATHISYILVTLTRFL